MQANIEYNYIEWKGWDPDTFGRYSNEENIQFAAEICRTGIKLDHETRVLEVGFGNGAFAGWIKQFTHHYIGIEANQELVDRANASDVKAYASIDELDAVAGDRKFDLIAAFDVIEHMSLNDIITTLQTWTSHLSTNGRILIRIPSGDSPFSGRIMYGDITHKTLLATTALQQIAPLAGLYLVATYPPALPIFGLGPLRTVQRAIVSAARKMITFLVNATFHGNRHGVVTSNLIAVLKHKAHASKTSSR